MISEDDVQCRVDETGTVCLKIDKKSINLDLRIWCKDRDAIYTALARFSGASDEGEKGR